MRKRWRSTIFPLGIVVMLLLAACDSASENAARQSPSPSEPSPAAVQPTAQLPTRTAVPPTATRIPVSPGATLPETEVVEYSAE